MRQRRIMRARAAITDKMAVHCKRRDVLLNGRPYVTLNAGSWRRWRHTWTLCLDFLPGPPAKTIEREVLEENIRSVQTKWHKLRVSAEYNDRWENRFIAGSSWQDIISVHGLRRVRGKGTFENVGRALYLEAPTLLGISSLAGETTLDPGYVLWYFLSLTTISMCCYLLFSSFNFFLKKKIN